MGKCRPSCYKTKNKETGKGIHRVQGVLGSLEEAEVVDHELSGLPTPPLERGRRSNPVLVTERRQLWVDFALDADMWQEGVALEHHDALDQGRDSGCSFSVADI